MRIRKTRKKKFHETFAFMPLPISAKSRGCASFIYLKIHLKSRFQSHEDLSSKSSSSGRLLNTQVNPGKLVARLGATNWDIPVQPWGKSCGLINEENKTKHKKNPVQWFYFCCIFDCNYCLKYFNCLAFLQVPCLWGGEAGQLIVCH